MPFIARTPEPPYYAVVFTSINADVDHTEHTMMYQRMVDVAKSYDGFLGIEPARNTDGSGVAVVYWKDLGSIAAFARDPEHLIAKKKGREIWYSHYMIDHVSIAVRDLEVSARVYERILALLGLTRLVERPATIGFGKRYPEFWLNLRASMTQVGADTGCHVCLRAPDEAAVRAFHAAALALGCTSAGDPGPRQAAMTTYFGAFIYDLDGNKIEAVTFPRDAM